MTQNQFPPLLLLLFSLGVGFLTGAEGDGEANSRMQPGLPDVRLAQPDEPRLHDFLRRPVLSIAGTTLGTLEDFLVDRTSGKLAHAVISVPNAPLHERLRLLRGDALRWQPGSASFEADEVAESRVNDSDALRRDGAFLRASSLPGQSVRAGGQVIGRITGVFIDIGTRTAAPVLAPSPAIIKTQRTFVVSLSRLRVGAADPKVATATITAEDLARAELAATRIEVGGSLPVNPITGASGITQSSVSGQTGYSTSQTATAATTDAIESGLIAKPLTPAGRGRTEAHGADALSRSAQAVRQMLQGTESNSGAAVEVLTEDGKLVLRGSVPSRTLKDQFEQRAASAAPGVAIESRLTVRGEAR